MSGLHKQHKHKELVQQAKKKRFVERLCFCSQTKCVGTVLYPEPLLSTVPRMLPSSAVAGPEHARVQQVGGAGKSARGPESKRPEANSGCDRSDAATTVKPLTNPFSATAAALTEPRGRTDAGAPTRKRRSLVPSSAVRPESAMDTKPEVGLQLA